MILMTLPASSLAQDKDAFRTEASAAAAKLRALGEPKDRCSLGAVVGEGAVVTRTFAPTPLVPGDRLTSLNGTELAGKSVDEIVTVLRAIGPAAVIPARIDRGGKILDAQVTCSNSRSMMTALVEGLDDAATGKFDDCVSVFAQRPDLGTYGAGVRARCASLSKDRKRYNLPQLAYDAMRMMLEDAQWVPKPRADLIGRLHSIEGFITQGLGSSRYTELVEITKRWPGGEGVYEAGAPDWRLFRRNAEAALRGKLIDPDSARIEWPHGFLYGTWKPLLSKRIDGYWSCGLINARNRMGGYTGSTSFVVVLDRSGWVQFTDIGTGRDFDILSAQCAKSGNMLPSPPPELAGAATAAATTPLSIADELKKLAELRASGAITEAEFQAAKQKLLGTPRQP
ncbi:MAG TPA: SHOCT domain-containing protein [Allosphingosinicella sp.]|jgi:hypothetical protein